MTTGTLRDTSGCLPGCLLNHQDLLTIAIDDPLQVAGDAVHGIPVTASGWNSPAAGLHSPAPEGASGITESSGPVLLLLNEEEVEVAERRWPVAQ